MSKKFKILVPIFQFGKSGGARVLAKLADYWIESGHLVDFVTFYESEKPYFPTKANIIWINENGEKVDGQVNTRSKKGLIKRIILLSSFIDKNINNYDVFLANYNITAIPVWMRARKKGYYYIQAYEPEFYTNFKFKDYIMKIISWSTYLFSITKIVNSNLYKKYKNLKSNYVIPPGLDLKTYYPKELFDDKKSLIVGCIGREEEWKGAHDVGEAVKILHEKGINVKLKVAFNNVKYKNHELVKPDGDNNLADYYRSLDVLVAPGHIQLGAIHYPVIEAMACNVPVITTGYYPANESNAFIVPIKSPSEIAKVLEEIYNNYSIAIEKAKIARKDILQFDWEIVSKKFINIFENKMR